MSTIKTLVVSHGAKALTKLKYHSPKIIMVGGVALVAAGTYYTIKATTEASVILDEAAEKREELDSYDESTFSDTKQLAKAYRDNKINTARQLAKIYAFPIGLTAAGTGLLVGSSLILEKRNTMLIGAYNALNAAYLNYRTRVVEEHGKETDFLYANNMEKTKDGINNRATNDIVAFNNSAPLSNNMSPYARIWNKETAPENWENVPEYNKNFLTLTQKAANAKLMLKGHLFLNEVYDMLGLERTSNGALTGWVYNENNPNGDNVISFDLLNDANMLALENAADTWYLDFNVDGIIYDLI